MRQKAWSFAQRKHAGQTRDGGEPFVIHPYSVAMYLVSLGYEDEILITAAYLHDTLEDTDTTVEELEKEFGETVAKIVQLLTCKRKDGESFRECSIRMADELAASMRNAKLIKLADRLHNLKTMSVWPDWKQKRYVKATRYLLEKIGDTDPALKRAIAREMET